MCIISENDEHYRLKIIEMLETYLREILAQNTYVHT